MVRAETGVKAKVERAKAHTGLGIGQGPCVGINIIKVFSCPMGMI